MVRCCDLCALARGVGEAAWLMWPDPWRVCLRHRRFTDDHRGQDPHVVALEGLPEVVRAHADRLRLERRFGAAGAELFADGFQMVARWWERTPDVWSWTQRAWRAGLEARELRTGPLVIYPEAVQLAREMLRYEQRGEHTPAARAVWVQDVQQLMAGWGLEDVDGWGELAQLPRASTVPPARPAASSSTRPAYVPTSAPPSGSRRRTAPRPPPRSGAPAATGRRAHAPPPAVPPEPPRAGPGRGGRP